MHHRLSRGGKHDAGRVSASRGIGSSAIVPRQISSTNSTITVPVRDQLVRNYVCSSVERIAVDASGSPVWVATAASFHPFYQFITGSDLWNTVSLTFDEFRPVALRIRYIPQNRYNRGLTTTVGPFTILLDVDSSALSVTENAAWQYTTARAMSADDPCEILYKIPQKSVGLWYDVASPATLSGCLCFASDTTQTVGTSLGLVYYEFEIQVRGQRG